jgi:ABC-type nitrate/sulfonate/bicarbonate transport system ATPase subunit|tara:strand:- start:79 stop:840 length:762 start_codon:yes stop_codon:yes gene_type:complete
MPTPRIELRHISKTFSGADHAVPVLEDVSFKVMPGEFVTIIGTSGSGKSTLFDLCVGLLESDEGEILIDGKPENRAGMVGYMPQHDLLLPWRSVLNNVLIPLEIQGIPRKESRQKALEMFPHFGLETFENEYPSVLSGGMRQRAALLRTWLMGRSTLLLDEPFGALDALTRKELQSWLLRVWKEFERTVVFITHDVEEAVYLADRVIVLSARPGVIKCELKIDLPRPRRQMMIAESEFGKLVRKLLEELGVDV